MTTDFKARPPSPVEWRSIPKHATHILRSLGYILWQIVVPFKSRPEEIAEFPEPDPAIAVSESHVKQCQWIFDQAEERRSHLEQKAQSTFSLMLFLVPLLLSLVVFVIGKGTTSKTFAFTLTLAIVSSIFLILAFIAAVRAIAVKGSETLFLDAVIDESGQFKKYSEAYHARGLLYCASMNTAMNDHIAQFVKGAHILSIREEDLRALASLRTKAMRCRTASATRSRSSSCFPACRSNVCQSYSVIKAFESQRSITTRGCVRGKSSLRPTWLGHGSTIRCSRKK